MYPQQRVLHNVPIVVSRTKQTKTAGKMELLAKAEQRRELPSS